MTIDLSLKVSPKAASDIKHLTQIAIKENNIDSTRVKASHIVKRSIDARQRNVVINITLRIWLDTMPESLTIANPVKYQKVADDKQAIIVGAGPAGLFAALRLIEHGIRPIVLERGKDVDHAEKI